MWLFLLFLSIPLIEITLFIQVGGAIGLWSTLFIVVLTAIVGSFLVRSQGLIAMRNLQSSFSTFNDPSEALAHGAMILVSGVLLLTPGFFTDFLGFAFCIPQVRNAVIQQVRNRVKVQTMQMHQSHDSNFYEPQNHDDVVDADYEILDAQNPSAGNTSKWGKH